MTMFDPDHGCFTEDDNHRIIVDRLDQLLDERESRAISEPRYMGSEQELFNRIKQGFARNRQAQRLKVSNREI